MSNIMPGLDVVVTGQAEALSQKVRLGKLGLLTNQTGLTLDGTPAWEALRKVGFNILALFSPEHGPRGVLEGEVASSHAEDGTPIHSLYGATKRPTLEMLCGLDAIVCDLQDVGARFYTYAATIFEVMEACAPLGVGVVVLDRPNPLGGIQVEGPLIEADLMSFIGPAPLPVTHGMTMGELALFYRDCKGLDIEVDIVRAQNWQRSMLWPDTGLEWQRPSPNLPDFTSAAWYPGLCLLEFSNLSVGRGTEAPFQIVGAPNFNAEAFIRCFEVEEPIIAEAINFTPAHAVFAGERCRGVRFMHPTLPSQPVEFGMRVMAAIRQSHPEFSQADWNKADKLLGSREVLDALWHGELDFAIRKSRDDAAAFQETRAPFLLY